MAVELCSDSPSMGMSPRISFSHDLAQKEGVPIEQYIRSSSSSSVDFDFCVFRESFDQESSSADELFFDGKILPIEIKKKLGTTKKLEPPAPPPESPNHYCEHFNASKKNESSSGKRLPVSESEDQKPNSKSFWRFKRSSSLNCGSGYARTLCPLPLLSRSNSTGSTQNAKRSSLSKDSLIGKHNNSQKSSTTASMKQSQAASSTSHQKPPLKKSYGSYSNSVKVNPVLNVPTPNLFGLGSIFSSGKDKNKKK